MQLRAGAIVLFALCLSSLIAATRSTRASVHSHAMIEAKLMEMPTAAGQGGGMGEV